MTLESKTFNFPKRILRCEPETAKTEVKQKLEHTFELFAMETEMSVFCNIINYKSNVIIPAINQESLIRPH